MSHPYEYTVVKRFLRYVTVDTQSDPHSKSVPSTEKQKNLGKMLVEELLALGIEDAHLDDLGYVYATLPSNSDKNTVPTICLCSHMDTSPDSSGKDVKPIVHENYNGEDLVLPDDPSVVIRLEEHPDLKEQMGNDIITASGTTLLGADNKAGLAEIMDAVHYFVQHPEVKHGPVRILFTPDEEIGRGVDHVDMEKLGADYGYTIDGEKLGSMEDETFSADGATITVHGVSAHTGFAKGKLVNAVKIAAAILAKLPNELAPEHTEGREGFIHPVSVESTSEKATIQFILRDFDEQGLAEKGTFLKNIVAEVKDQYPKATIEVNIYEQYRNMKKILDQHPQVVDHAVEAIRRAGLPVRKSSIRGGTDGSRLSFMGLPCPNIFAGEHAFHSKQEWVTVQDMQKAVDTIINLVQIWEERS